MEKNNLVFFCLFVLLLAHLQGWEDDVDSATLLLLHPYFQHCHIATPLAEGEEEEKVERNLDPETVGMRKKTGSHEDDDRVQDVDDGARANGEVDQRPPFIYLLLDVLTDERRQFFDDIVKIFASF